MVKLLYNDALAPITSELGFLKCDAKTAASTFLAWHTKIRSPLGQVLEEKDLADESLDSLIRHLLPLANMHTRFLFVPTRGQWTAFFDNSWCGSDPASICSYLAEQIGCLGIRAVWVPNTFKERKGHLGAVIFEVYDKPNPILNIRRSICLINDGNWTTKWDFETSGEPFDFEDVERYKTRRKTDRFTPEMLDNYLKALGIDAFSEDFYCASKECPAKLISIHGKIPDDVTYYSLKEAREDY